MISYVILSEELYDKEFINDRVKGFDEYKTQILNDEKANPNFIKTIKGYEELEAQIYHIARNLASKKSLIFWGLGITEHIDGSKAVMAIANLALITGNIGKDGAGLMPLRGQNNVQGACDVGCLPYYLPDYQAPLEENIGLTTPKLIDEMIEGNIKALYNMGEDLRHIHPNQNKIQKAIQNLDLIIVQELFVNEIAKEADIVFGVKSAYEKRGVYVNAMRRLHLSQPLVKNSLPDDWEVIKDIENKINGNFLYNTSENVWDDTRAETTRYAGASYIKLKKHTAKGLQWPVTRVDTPMLHTETFATDDGYGHLSYYPYELRNQVKELINSESNDTFYLTTGRTLVHYNNSAQTMHTTKLDDSYGEDIVLACIDDKDKFDLMKSDEVILKSRYGQSARLRVKFSKKIKKGTLFTTFHKADSKINYLFGDESDSFTQTACFKSVEVEIIK
jgi:formate dehydrogenase major subunit